MYLRKAELTELTGFRRPSYMCRWLATHRWVYEEGADGYPRVLRGYWSDRMRGRVQPATKIAPTDRGMNLQALEEVG